MHSEKVKQLKEIYLPKLAALVITSRIKRNPDHILLRYLAYELGHFYQTLWTIIFLVVSCLNRSVLSDKNNYNHTKLEVT